MKNETIEIIERLELEHARLETIVKVNELMIYAAGVLGGLGLFLLWL